jgi:conjugal transfer pilus assembly protein TraV
MIKKIIPLLLLMLCLAACSAKTFNPYDDEFDCPYVDRGKCVSVDDAYRESLEENNLIQEDVSPPQKATEQKNQLQNEEAGEEKTTPSGKPKTASYNYQEALYHELTGMLKEPETPLVIPPKTMRVLLLSYTSENNELYGDRFVYFFATEATWSTSTAKETRQWDQE